MTQNAHNLWA